MVSLGCDHFLIVLLPHTLKSKAYSQSMRNVFELRRTFCPANYGSLAGHFGILPDISCLVKEKISSPDILPNFFLPNEMSNGNLLLQRTFEIFTRHVR